MTGIDCESISLPHPCIIPGYSFSVTSDDMVFEKFTGDNTIKRITWPRGGSEFTIERLVVENAYESIDASLHGMIDGLNKLVYPASNIPFFTSAAINFIELAMKTINVDIQDEHGYTSIDSAFTLLTDQLPLLAYTDRKILNELITTFDAIRQSAQERIDAIHEIDSIMDGGAVVISKEGPRQIDFPRIRILIPCAFVHRLPAFGPDERQSLVSFSNVVATARPDSLRLVFLLFQYQILQDIVAFACCPLWRPR